MEPRPPDDREDASGNESEEVDDIELIFTTDESKDISNLQVRLLSSFGGRVVNVRDRLQIRLVFSQVA